MKFFTGQGPREINAHKIYCSAYQYLPERRSKAIPNENLQDKE